MNIQSVLLLVLLSVSLPSMAIVNGHEYPFDQGTEAQNQSRAEIFQLLSYELRCPKCQNQNLADSNAMIAGDLRRELYSQVLEDKTADDIVDFMVNRYGEFVLYKPKLAPITFALWYGPFILAGIALLTFGWILISRRKKQDKHSQPELSAQDEQRLADILKADTDEEKP